MDIKELLPLLRSNGVKRFKDSQVEIEFDALPLEPAKLVDVPMPANMPNELKNPETMSMDQILNWSSSPDHTDAPPLPLTGDAPLMAPTMGNEP